VRIGIDWGGTKIEAVALGDDGRVILQERIATPRGDYDASIRVTAELVQRLERAAGARGSVGVGIPGIIRPETGLVKNANSTWLIGKPFKRDLETALGRSIRCANDANCLALSEATDGAGVGQRVVFAAILGTGCGGGIAIDGTVIEGRSGIAGEWGHNALPWPQPDEYPGRLCYCGRYGCIETWLCGPAFERDYERATGLALSGKAIADRAIQAEPAALDTLTRYEDRLSRGLAHVVNIVDPDVIVLGGGMSNVERLYQSLPQLVASYVFGECNATPILRAHHGDSSGVRGAAWLWPLRGAS
jgi:fructokinase